MVLSDNRLLQGQVLLLYPQSGHGLRESELVWKNLSHGTAAGYPIRQCQEGSDPEESDRSFQSYIIPALRLRLGIGFIAIHTQPLCDRKAELLFVFYY